MTGDGKVEAVKEPTLDALRGGEGRGASKAQLRSAEGCLLAASEH